MLWCACLCHIAIYKLTKDCTHDYGKSRLFWLQQVDRTRLTSHMRTGWCIHIVPLAICPKFLELKFIMKVKIHKWSYLSFRWDCCLHRLFASRHLGFRKLQGGRARNLHDQPFSFSFVANSIPVCLRLIIVTRILCILEGGVMCKYLINLTFSRMFEPEGVKALKASLFFRWPDGGCEVFLFLCVGDRWDLYYVFAEYRTMSQIAVY